MFDKEFWEEIKEKYSKAYSKFRLFYGGFESSLLTGNNEICFCNLEKFFDEQGIILLSWHDTIKKIFYLLPSETSISKL